MSKTKNSSPVVPENPYLAARAEWNERYGNYINQAKSWRIAAIISGVVSVAAVAGVIYIGSQSKLIPYVVAVDKHGSAVAAGIATAASPFDQKVVRSFVGRFVEDLRSVIVDPQAERMAVERVYSMLPGGSPSLVHVSEFFKTESPFERAAKGGVSVQIENIQPISNETWLVEFTEISRNLQGSTLSKQKFKATLQVKQFPIADEKMMRLNPAGVFVQDISIVKTL